MWRFLLLLDMLLFLVDGHDVLLLLHLLCVVMSSLDFLLVVPLLCLIDIVTVVLVCCPVVVGYVASCSIVVPNRHCSTYVFLFLLVCLLARMFVC